MLKSKLSLLPLLIFLSAFFSSCSWSKAEKNYNKIRTIIDEADLLISARQFQDAEAKIQFAVKKISTIDRKESKDANAADILTARAYTTLFIAKNVLVIEEAKPLARNLIKLPPLKDYIDYQSTVIPAEKLLENLLEKKEELKEDELASVYAMLGTLHRLNIYTAKEADEDYRLAAIHYENILRELQGKERKSIFNFSVEQVEGQIRQMQLARIEVNLLLERWNKALTLLEKMMAGRDLKFFPVQFEIMEERIAQLEDKLRKQKGNSTDPRTKRLEQFFSAQRSKRQKQNPGSELSELGTIEAELFLADIKLTEMKNNLIYRAICYKQLRQNERLNHVEKTLRQYYPQIEKELLEIMN